METNEPKWFLYTDGSGHTDGYGGCACVAVRASDSHAMVTVVAHSATTVTRMEFEALLCGLQSIMDSEDWNTPAARMELARERCKVVWKSDRADLVGCVDAAETGHRRKGHPDMWRRFSFYEELFDIKAIFEPRNTDPSQALADKYASEARILIKDHMEAYDQVEQI